jgi:plasmid stabilization system protein ParE
MKNIYKIDWTEEASSNLDEIIRYLENRWTAKEVSAFLIRLRNLIKTIQKTPLAFPLSKSLKIRRAVLSKQTTLYYNVSGDIITIISLFDNRKNPNKKDY